MKAPDGKSGAFSWSDTVNGDGPVRKRKLDVLGLEEMSRDGIIEVLDVAESMREIMDRPIKKVPTLRGRSIATLFYEPSTRTRVSFELAAKQLSADVVSISSATSSVQKGESLIDTGRTLERMGIELIVIRHPSAGAPHFLARHLKVPVINAGDGQHEHPTQGLLDMFTIARHRRSLGGKSSSVLTFEGLKVAIVGDILHSRVARSNIWGLSKLGAEVVVSGPKTLLPLGLEGMGAKWCIDVDSAIEDADVVMVLRLQLERQRKGLLPDLKEYSELFGITPERLRRAKRDVLLMHPGPVNRGIELSSELMEMEHTVIEEQVENGVAVRMALLYLVLGEGSI